MRQLPNILTLSRIVIIPILIASFYLESKLYHWIAASLFLLASITDFFDGYLARAMKVQSSLGRFLDPIADKLIVAAAIVMLVHVGSIGRFDVLAAVTILCREILVSGLREFLAELRISVPVSRLAKIKTATQMTALFLLLWGIEGPSLDEFEHVVKMSLTELLGRILLWISAVLTVVTGYAYFKAARKHFEDS